MRRLIRPASQGKGDASGRCSEPEMLGECWEYVRKKTVTNVLAERNEEMRLGICPTGIFRVGRSCNDWLQARGGLG